MRRVAVITLLLSALPAALPIAQGAFAVTPTPKIYALPAYQSPVRADPDDLLLLPGYGFDTNDIVVYQATPDGAAVPTPPARIASSPTAASGRMPIVSTADVPDSLTVRLPSAMRANQPYVLWVRNEQGVWSNPVKINDARPLWVSPGDVYSTAAEGLPRMLKVVGRNLRPDPGQTLQLRLTGPVRLTLTARAPLGLLDDYVARFALPRLDPGRYRMALARDSAHWVPIPDQLLIVRPDSPAPVAFRVGDPRFGACRPNDGLDDTACVLKAIAAAHAAGGGAVVFDGGVWDLVNANQPGVQRREGILVPAGVDLIGRGTASTRVIRHTDWSAAQPVAAFSLLGNNVVEGLTFADSQRYLPTDDGAPFLQLGQKFEQLASLHADVTTAISDIRISHNRFDRTFVGIADGGLPLKRIIVSYNDFGAYRTGLELGGDRYNLVSHFALDDSVIAFNTFKPGSYLRTAARQGAIASEIGASHRVDFSNNLADGTSAAYLYPGDDARGWRAAFFWHLMSNQEMLLISDNVAACSGDKIGDGEAFSLDNNTNTFAFDDVRTVLAADRSSVTVAGPLSSRQNDRDIQPMTYYVGHWIQVGNGPGLGQVRKIVGYQVDRASGDVTFDVDPEWDVVPVGGTTRISVGREFWQTYLVGNRVEHRSPPCLKSNRSRDTGGAIVVWAQTADSVVGANLQYDTSGIEFNQSYDPSEHACNGCTAQTYYQSFLEVRDNQINGTYDTASDCNTTGILSSISAAPWGSAPPTLGFGITIAHNRLIHTDNARGGALGFVKTWYGGPGPGQWPLVVGTLVDHNLIVGVDSPIKARRCNSGHPRTGIGLPAAALTRAVVLYANTCSNLPVPLDAAAQQATRCTPTSQLSCGCPVPGHP